MPKTSIPLLLLGVALFLSACSAAHRDFDLNKGEADGKGSRAAEVAELFSDSLSSTTTRPVYEVVPGDELEVVFFTHPEQNRFVKVRPDGRISLPYVGDMDAAGLTPEDLGNSIQIAFSEVLVNPRVNILVNNVASKFYVMGEVNRAGEYELERDLDLLQAIARAGGHSDEARLSSVVLLRKSDEGTAYAAVLNFRDFMGDNARATVPKLQPDDIVWVPRDMISRWDDAAVKSFKGVQLAAETVISGWSLINFSDVFEIANARQR